MRPASELSDRELYYLSLRGMVVWAVAALLTFLAGIGVLVVDGYVVKSLLAFIMVWMAIIFFAVSGHDWAGWLVHGLFGEDDPTFPPLEDVDDEIEERWTE